MCICVCLHEYPCAHECRCSVKLEVADPLETELLAVVNSSVWVLRNELGVAGRAVKYHNR